MRFFTISNRKPEVGPLAWIDVRAFVASGASVFISVFRFPTSVFPGDTPLSLAVQTARGTGGMKYKCARV